MTTFKDSCRPCAAPMVFEFFKNIDFQSVKKFQIFDFLCISIGAVKGLKRYPYQIFYNYIRKYKILIFSILTLVKISEDTPFLGSKCMNPLTFGGRCGAHLNIDCTLSLYIFYTFFQIPLYAQAAYLDWWLRLKIGVVWICWRNQFNC